MSAPDYTFASDNTTGVCPEAWNALSAANTDCAPSYGADKWTERAKKLIDDVFETSCEVAFVFNGTAANALALSTICQRHMSIICHEISHVDTDECGAPEFFTGGSKVIPLPGDSGKLQAPIVAKVFGRGHGIHYPKPGALSITQSTEVGTVYTPQEITALADLAHSRGLSVHMDGARFSNAIASLKERSGFSPADVTWRAGVDILSLGGTKNGMLGTEAIIFFNKGLAKDLEYRVKQSGQLASKMRFAAAQWVAMLESRAWIKNGARANRAAARLANGLRDIKGCRLQSEPEVNGVFVELPPAVASGLMEGGWHFYPFFGENGYRLMCSWETSDETIDRFLVHLRRLA